MDVQIVRRGRKFEGLTLEGERVLAWAQQMLEDCQRLKRELSSFREQAMNGPFKVGVSPATIALASVMSVPFTERVPAVKLSVETMGSDLPLKALRSGQIDIALSYLAEAPEEGLSHHLLYREQMLVLTPGKGAATLRASLKDAMGQPLCLLRASLPAELEARLSSAPTILWTDSMMILESTLATGRYATVIPQSLASHLSPRSRGGADSMCASPLKDPQAQANVGFITLRVDPVPALLHLWIELAHTPELVKSIRSLLNSYKMFAKK